MVKLQEDLASKKSKVAAVQDQLMMEAETHERLSTQLENLQEINAGLSKVNFI